MKVNDRERYLIADSQNSTNDTDKESSKERKNFHKKRLLKVKTFQPIKLT